MLGPDLTDEIWNKGKWDLEKVILNEVLCIQ